MTFAPERLKWLGGRLVEVGDEDALTIDLTHEDLPQLVVEKAHVPFVDVVADYRWAEPEIDAAVRGVLERGDFILGEAVRRFEEEFASYCGVGHAVGVDSGFSALELIIRGLGIGPGDEVITVANTFIATAAAIEAAGARPVLVDMDPATYNIDPNRIEDAVTPNTRAVIAVHLYGRPADMDAINQVAGRYGLFVIEDACQAHGATVGDRRAGSLGTAAAFSFYPSKNLGAFGDGGVVVTNDPDLAERVRLLRNLGSAEKYHHSVRGFNRRLDTLQAAVLSVKLGGLDEANDSRRNAARLYASLLADLPIVVPPVDGGHDSVFHLYVIETGEREALMGYLRDEGISTGIHYPIPIHLQEGYRSLGYGPGDFPHTEEAAQRVMSLPMFGRISPAAVIRSAQAVQRFFER